MKLLWITFAPVGRACWLFHNRMTQSGGWVDATSSVLRPYMRENRMTLHIVCMGGRDMTIVDPETSITYSMVNMRPCRGKRADKSHVDIWRRLIGEISPDLIQIWGTEFSFGLDVMDAAGTIPVCFYIQGVMSSLAEHPFGDIPGSCLALRLGPKAWPKLLQQSLSNRKNRVHVPYEMQMVERSVGILTDNQWTQAQYQLRDEKAFFVPLSVNPCFRNDSWSVQKCQRHTLFTVAGGGCPQKGVHNAVMAIAMLKEKYPDIRLYIPGNISSRKPHFLYDNVYIRQVRKLIAVYGLQEHVIFLGALSLEQMAQQMRRANVFVMPSCVETHSSTLREAMTVGVPCVSAMVGSVPEFLEHGKHGFLYRYGEVATLAHYIDKIFSDDTLAQSVGAAGQRSVNEKYPQDQVGAMLMEAYEKMLMEKGHEKV